MRWQVAPLVGSLFVLAACSGNSSSSAIPNAPRTAPAMTPARIAVTIAIPSSTTPAAVRRTRFVSPATQSMAIAVNGGSAVVANLTPASPGCSTTTSGVSCTVSVVAPVGADTFSVTLFSGTNGTGSALSEGRVASTVVAGTSNTLALALDGIIASLAVTLANATPPQGVAATVGVTITAKDAAGAAIVGADAFSTPIALTDSDTSGATSLSKTSVVSPSDGAAVVLSYTGAPLSGGATVGATAGGVAATPAHFAPSAAATMPAFNDYVTFGYDNAHDVYNPNSAAFTAAALPAIHLGWETPVNGGDFNTQTQPMVATDIPGHAAVLFAGGGTGDVSAYDGLTGAMLWKRSFGQELFTCENSADLYFGIGGSVAYDPATRSVYVAGNQNATANAAATNTLYRLDAATGATLGSVAVAPQAPGWNSLDFVHTSVVLAGGLAYVGTGATCDIASWRGRLQAVNVPAMTLAPTFYPAWNPPAQPWGGGGVWGWGGVTIDDGGNVLTGVGNTDNGETSHGTIVAPFVAAPTEYAGYGEALVQLRPDLSAVAASSHPIPTNAYSGSSVDLDLNGTPAVIHPRGGIACDPEVVIQGKSGTVYFFDDLDIGAGPIAQFALAPSSYQDSFLGQPAYSPLTGLVYVSVPSSQGSLFPPGLVAIDPHCGHPAVAWNTAFGPDSGTSGTPRGVPAVSAGGVVFVGTPCVPDNAGGCGGSTTAASQRMHAQAQRRMPLICCSAPSGQNAAVWALDASSGALLNGGLPIIITTGPLRMPPTIDGAWMYVLDNNSDLYALTVDPSVPTAAETSRRIDPRMIRRWATPRT